ncbi:MAG: HU family DNA-binding protein [Muribaculaceae bacterium]|nr:HU family DNA-binding protein [Muribaculaceae bacterium]
MDNKQFISLVAQLSHRPVADINNLVLGITECLRESSLAGDSVAIPGFGTFTPIKSDEQIVTDRSTGKKLLLPPELTLNFSSSSVLRKKIHSSQ